MAQVKKTPKVQPSVIVTVPQSHAMRETVESIVIAFVLAFLFRTFEAEAFVIPTGSMAPTLMGRHKDVDCPKCGHRYRVSASEEEGDGLSAVRLEEMKCVGGMCPMCRYVMAMTPNLPGAVLDGRDPQEIQWQPSYNGDRILVNKYVYTVADPERWDVVVFHFPGNAQMNYIKRMVGLPGETLRVFQGDLYARASDAPPDAEFQILHKPADKFLAVRQLVHDTNYDPIELIAAGWPLRWQKVEGEGANWVVNTEPASLDMREQFSIDRSGEGEAWLRYHHFVPEFGVWDQLIRLNDGTTPNATSAAKLPENVQARPQLIMDFNAYNTRLIAGQVERQGLRVDPSKTGVHWVGDLMLEADVDVEAARGELLLDLVEGGKHFTCRIDLTNGKATLGAEGAADYAPAATTALAGTGKHRVGFANVDDQLLLWVDGSLIHFEGGTTYDAKAVFGDREKLRPQTSAEHPGDLAPAGVGALDAKLSISRLRMWRDIYYIADSARNSGDRFGGMISDYNRSAERFFDSLPSDSPVSSMRGRFNATDRLLQELPLNPALWDRFYDRRHEDFLLGNDQYFVMGDNSAESSDARLWRGESRGGRPGGEYLERRLLIGKALCVYWPHAWYYIPATPIPVFPNFRDMRLVR